MSVSCNEDLALLRSAGVSQGLTRALRAPTLRVRMVAASTIMDLVSGWREAEEAASRVAHAATHIVALLIDPARRAVAASDMPLVAVTSMCDGRLAEVSAIKTGAIERLVGAPSREMHIGSGILLHRAAEPRMEATARIRGQIAFGRALLVPALPETTRWNSATANALMAEIDWLGDPAPSLEEA